LGPYRATGRSLACLCSELERQCAIASSSSFLLWRKRSDDPLVKVKAPIPWPCHSMSFTHKFQRLRPSSFLLTVASGLNMQDVCAPESTTFLGIVCGRNGTEDRAWPSVTGHTGGRPQLNSRMLVLLSAVLVHGMGYSRNKRVKMHRGIADVLV
jgi:hypothetical protein